MKSINLRLAALCGNTFLVSATSAQNAQPKHTTESGTPADARGLNRVAASDARTVDHRIDIFLQYNF